MESLPHRLLRQCDDRQQGVSIPIVERIIDRPQGVTGAAQVGERHLPGASARLLGRIGRQARPLPKVCSLRQNLILIVLDLGELLITRADPQRQRDRTLLVDMNSAARSVQRRGDLRARDAEQSAVEAHLQRLPDSQVDGEPRQPQNAEGEQRHGESQSRAEGRGARALTRAHGSVVSLARRP